jgi:hypothetical protein
MSVIRCEFKADRQVRDYYMSSIWERSIFTINIQTLIIQID